MSVNRIYSLSIRYSPFVNRILLIWNILLTNRKLKFCYHWSAFDEIFRITFRFRKPSDGLIYFAKRKELDYPFAGNRI